MALSEETKQKFDEVLAAMAKEGYTVFGAWVNGDSSELQPFGNCGDNPQAWVHNMITAAQAVEEPLNLKNEA